MKGHDFIDPTVPKAVPCGVYDINDNKGRVNVGTSADTADFAVDSIRYWWHRMGNTRYPKARELLICADSGGSNGYRSHLWKLELQQLADRERLTVTVCHFPPDTSKWNKIEHKLFSFITMNWRGRPLLSYRTIVKFIAATTTQVGLTVKVQLDQKKYKTGIKVSPAVLETIAIQKHAGARSMASETTRSRRVKNRRRGSENSNSYYLTRPKWVIHAKCDVLDLGM